MIWNFRIVLYLIGNYLAKRSVLCCRVAYKPSLFLFIFFFMAWTVRSQVIGTGETILTSSQISQASSSRSGNDGSAIELGVKFRTSVGGTITGLRFYKSSTNTGTHIGQLWSSTGTLLGQATFTNETSSGWQQVNLANPVAISAGVTYIAAYHSSSGNYSTTSNYFSTTVANGTLKNLANGEDGPNGLYRYTSSPAFPTNSYSGSNYWVDVVFTANDGSDGTAPAVVSVSPVNNAMGVSTSASVTAVFSESLSPSSVTGSTVFLRAGATTVPATLSYAAGSTAVTLTPSSALSASTVYTVTLKGGTGGIRDASGNALAVDYVWSFTTAAIGGSGSPVTILTSSQISQASSSRSGNDGSAIELGVKFRTSVGGTITGLRFYKSSTNTGTHIGQLWSSTGTLLGQATFTNETSSGWQQVNLANPVAISAGVTYIAAYHSSSGNYSTTSNYFSTTVANGNLKNLANGEDGPNGLYRYTSSPAFPTNSYSGSNYWVDVVFTANDGSDGTAPAVVSVSPVNNAMGVSTSASVTAVFSESLSPSSVTGSTVFLRAGATTVPATLSYAAGSTAVTLTPSSALSASTVYTVTLKGGTGGIRDASGNALAVDYVWSFTTAAIGGSGSPVTILTSSQISQASSSRSGNDGSAIELGVKFRASVGGTITGLRFYKSSTNTGTHIGQLWSSTGTLLGQATFTNETSSGWQQVNLANPVSISAGTTYIAAYHSSSGNYSTTSNYFSTTVANGTLKNLANGEDGPNGLYRYTSSPAFPTNSYAGSNYWVDVVFTANGGSDGTPPTDDPIPPINQGPGGPILVISSSGNPFSRYYAEILRAEGLNSFYVMDISSVNSTVLNSYDVVLLGEMGVDASQVTMLTNWVNAGGTLVAFKPHSSLLPLLGLTSAGGSTLADRYLLVNTASGPGVGIVNQTIQYHGTADLYNLNGATSAATIYSGASTSTTNPAVSINTVGSNGGKAVAFSYDLAKSIVYTRQGNPAWAGQKRDGQGGPIRSDDLFFPDYVDLNKVAIPQADEQQRLLTNIIIQNNLNKKPLPRFWFLPRKLKAAVVMTGDDHANGGTISRFNQYLGFGNNTAQDVQDWRAIRGTSYIYSSFSTSILSDAQASSFNAQGFEISLHTNTNCVDYTQSSLYSLLNTQLSEFAGKYPSLPQPKTHRSHCLAWSDWASKPKVENQFGIRLNTDYYYWPGSWIQNRPGMFTGSGMPMRFADLDGTLIDNYQVTTQMTDESDVTYPAFINTLLDNATGSAGYYGVFCANMHTDFNSVGNPGRDGSDAIIASAIARQIPVISAKQMLTWLDGRNTSSFGSMSWSSNNLNFTITVGSGAYNLQSMVPVDGPGGLILNGILYNGSGISYTTEVIKGINYAFFDAQAGNYVATYGSGQANSNGVNTNRDVSSSVSEPVSYFLGQNYPNPVNGSSTIMYRVPVSGKVEIALYDMQGRQVMMLVNDVKGAGVHKLVFNGNKLSGGVYYYKMMSGNFVAVKRLVIE